ncbi:RNA recognition motif domain-containing protein [Ditylenchus destructor]|uniref:RNA recognition motif domain-containing protein n=1 Tax=Ditylenchus destructor TaxID=166010 RepID=A0AAD4MXE7_9BILA|nr:RNA recognition motif domain-containing protein [Ditylenchus destructor]
MLSFFRPSRTYSHQLFNTRRQLCVFTSTIPIRRNVNHEETRKLSTYKSLPIEFYSAHWKEKLLSIANRCHWTSQFYGFQSFSSKSSGVDEARTIMVANLSKDTTEDSLRKHFIKKNWDMRDCQIIRHKKTGISRQFGFVEFATAAEAELASKDRHFIDCKEVSVKMSGTKDLDDKYRIFVGGLLKETSGKTLHHYFSQFGDVFECHIVHNEDNLSKGFGFVTYKSQDSVDRALNARPHSIDNKVVDIEHTPPCPRKLTMFVGNLSPKTTDESLRKHFSKYGQLTQSEVKIDSKTGLSRGFGYVGFRSKEKLERAQAAQPHIIDGVKVTFNSKGQFLVIDSLSPNITEDSLRKFFSQYGQVQDCRRITNSVGRTTVFVTMSNEEETSRALADRPHYIKGKLVSTHLKGREFSLRLLDIPEHTTDDDLYETFSKS